MRASARSNWYKKLSRISIIILKIEKLNGTPNVVSFSEADVLQGRPRELVVRDGGANSGTTALESQRQDTKESTGYGRQTDADAHQEQLGEGEQKRNETTIFKA